MTSLDLRRSANTGIWDTILNNTYWVSGAAISLDAPLLNASNGTVNFALADGGSFSIFASDTSNLFVAGSNFTLSVGFADGTTATASFTIPTPPPANIALNYNGKLRDRVGKSETALTADGFLDGTFTVTLQAGSGNRTVTSLDLRRSANTGIWDTILNNTYWVSGAAISLDAPLLNASNGTVNFALADGGSFSIFASDTSNLFAAGSNFTLSVGFADGTTATASFTIPTPPPANIALNYNGKLRDRVGKSETALTADGFLDGTFTVTLQAGSGNRTVTSLDLRRSANTGIWDTILNNTYWVSGAAISLDAPLLNASNGTVNFALADGGSFSIFASDTSNLFAAGSNFTLSVGFSDGTNATASAMTH